jgi:hypothetical protein
MAVSLKLTNNCTGMYQYYQEATMCFIHLANTALVAGKKVDVTHLRRCRWFKRSWTLQELIASPRAQIYDMKWRLLGAKHELIDILSTITSIPEKVLKDPQKLLECSIAERMSWAAQREATVEEDIAYSLLGIFTINMPLLYGEGPKAFIRLQEEIMKQSNDMSIFAWGNWTRIKELPQGHVLNWERNTSFSGFLATHPIMFRDSKTIDCLENPVDRESVLRSKTIQVERPWFTNNSCVWIITNCHFSNSLTQRLVIPAWELRPGLLVRVSDDLFFVNTRREGVQILEEKQFHLVRNNYTRDADLLSELERGYLVECGDHWIIEGPRGFEDEWDQQRHILTRNHSQSYGDFFHLSMPDDLRQRLQPEDHSRMLRIELRHDMIAATTDPYCYKVWSLRLGVENGIPWCSIYYRGDRNILEECKAIRATECHVFLEGWLVSARIVKDDVMGAKMFVVELEGPQRVSKKKVIAKAAPVLSRIARNKNTSNPWIYSHGRQTWIWKDDLATGCADDRREYAAAASGRGSHTTGAVLRDTSKDAEQNKLHICSALNK